MGMIDRLRSLGRTDQTYQDAWARSVVSVPPWPPSFDPAMPWANIGGRMYPLGMNQTLQGNREEPPGDFAGLVDYLYKQNSVVFSCVDNRVKLFSEARFQYRRFRNGRPGDLFGDASLALLETPWPGGTTGDLLSKMLQYADLEGDAFVLRLANRFAVLRPDWTTIVLDGDASDPRATVLGYAYHPNGPYSRDLMLFAVEEVAHFAPIPDPLTPHRGMSWMTPIVREVMADTAMTNHKRSYLENGATVNAVVTIDVAGSKASFDELVAKYKAGHEGVGNAYKTLFATPAMKVEPIGSNLEQIDFKVVQGAGETRIAAAAGVPPVIVGLSEGLAAATYSNYAQARRRFADNTIRPLWRNVAGSLASIINVPPGAELWYDDRDISALQEDQKDAADILSVNVASIVAAVNGGFEPPSAIAAVTSGDLTQLVHTGLTSVQLQPPAPDEPPEPPEPSEPVAEVPDAEDTAPSRAELIEWLVSRPQPAPQVVIEEGAVTLVQKRPMRSIIERDESGTIVGSYEEPVFDAD